MPSKILVTEQISEEGINALLSKGYKVDVKLDLTPEQLIEAIPEYDALIVRSATKVTGALLDAAENLKIIGRAGVTVDNIDLEAAAAHNVIVCNAPTSNIVSAAEHTMALLLSCARKVPQANSSVHGGKWERHRFMGRELNGKTLAIFGLGRVGSAVAERARAFGMEVIAFDPYCSPDKAAELGVELYENMEDILPVADFITVHLPRTADTVGMFGPEEFAAMKNGVILINSARGGIYDIQSLADFVAAGKIAAAAIDIFEDEPCLDSPLHSLENVILTPHISAVTKEAQVLAGTQIAEYVWAGLEGSIVPTAINSTDLPPEIIDEVGPYIPACKMLGRMAEQLLGHMPKSISVTLQGELAGCNPDPLLAGVADGVISYKQSSAATIGGSLAVARRHGISMEAHRQESADEYASSVSVQADGIQLAATLFGLDKRARIISIEGYKIDIAPAKQSLIFEYVDGPGRIGTIGNILGDAGINITTMQIGTKPEEKCALVYVNVEGDVSQEIMEKLKSAIDLKSLNLITL